MYIAIKNLLEEPQNNLKIFKVSLMDHVIMPQCKTLNL